MSWVSFVWTGESVGHATKGSHGASAIKVVVRPRPRRRWLFAFNFKASLVDRLQFCVVLIAGIFKEHDNKIGLQVEIGAGSRYCRDWMTETGPTLETDNIHSLNLEY